MSTRLLTRSQPVPSMHRPVESTSLNSKQEQCLEEPLVPSLTSHKPTSGAGQCVKAVENTCMYCSTMGYGKMLSSPEYALCTSLLEGNVTFLPKNRGIPSSAEHWIPPWWSWFIVVDLFMWGLIIESFLFGRCDFYLHLWLSLSLWYAIGCPSLMVSLFNPSSLLHPRFLLVKTCIWIVGNPMFAGSQGAILSK
jgi:hypothetical protein